MRHPEWSEGASATWTTLSPIEQEQVARAVDRFAKLGEGDIETDVAPSGIKVRLYVGQFIVAIGLPPEEEGLIVDVLWVYRIPQ